MAGSGWIPQSFNYEISNARNSPRQTRSEGNVRSRPETNSIDVHGTQPNITPFRERPDPPPPDPTPRASLWDNPVAHLSTPSTIGLYRTHLGRNNPHPYNTSSHSTRPPLGGLDTRQPVETSRRFWTLSDGSTRPGTMGGHASQASEGNSSRHKSFRQQGRWTSEIDSISTKSNMPSLISAESSHIPRREYSSMGPPPLPGYPYQSYSASTAPLPPPGYPHQPHDAQTYSVAPSPPHLASYPHQPNDAQTYSETTSMPPPTGYPRQPYSTASALPLPTDHPQGPFGAAMPPLINFPQQQHGVASAPPTPHGHHQIRYVFVPPNTLSAPSNREMSQRQLTTRISKEYVAKKLIHKGFESEAERKDEVQIPVVKEIFFSLETKYFGEEGFPGRTLYITEDLPKITRAPYNRLHLGTFNKLLNKLGLYYPDMKVPPDSQGVVKVGSSHWNHYTAVHAKVLGGERDRHSLDQRLFLHKKVEGGFRWYENEGLKEIIIKCLFSKPTSLGIAFPELFPHISPPCLAFFVVMDINEFELACEDGKRSDRFFLTDKLYSQFRVVLAHIRALFDADPLFRQYLKDLVVDARARFADLEAESKKSNASKKKSRRQNSSSDHGQMGQSSAASSSSLAGALGYD